jgi:hypothetical protein
MKPTKRVKCAAGIDDDIKIWEPTLEAAAPLPAEAARVMARNRRANMQPATRPGLPDREDGSDMGMQVGGRRLCCGGSCGGCLYGAMLLQLLCVACSCGTSFVSHAHVSPLSEAVGDSWACRWAVAVGAAAAALHMKDIHICCLGVAAGTCEGCCAGLLCLWVAVLDDGRSSDCDGACVLRPPVAALAMAALVASWWPALQQRWWPASGHLCSSAGGQMVASSAAALVARWWPSVQQRWWPDGGQLCSSGELSHVAQLLSNVELQSMHPASR